MKQNIALVLLLCAGVAALFSLFGDDSYSHMRALEKSVTAQKATNQELESKVTQIRQKVRALRTDDRELEKAARNELGLARPDELIFIFDEKGNDIQANSPTQSGKISGK